MAAHAKLSPSGATIWMNCAGSVEAQAVEPNDANVWSAEGTAAHKVLEQCLRFGVEPTDFLGKVWMIGDENQKFKITVDVSMVEYLTEIVDEIRDMGGIQIYEEKLDLSEWMGKDQFGTLDVGAILLKKNRVVIRDLKYGKGLAVSPILNKQLMIYALGFWYNFAWKYWKDSKKKPTFRIVIDQPRNNGGGGYWDISYDDLMDFGETVEAAAKAAMKPGAKRTAGPHCGYCRSAMNLHCRQYDQYVANAADLKLSAFDQKLREQDLPDLYKIDPERRRRILEAAPMIGQWLKRMHADAINDGLAGRPLAGLKVVEGRKGNRKWVDEEVAEKWLIKTLKRPESRFEEPKLISPAKAEALLGKGGRKILTDSGQYEQPLGKLSLVDESHPSPPVRSMVDRFDEFMDDEFE